MSLGSPPVVLLDACVLYPAALRDLLMRLAVHDLIAARWSEKIHEEWMTAVLRTRPDLQLHQLEAVDSNPPPELVPPAK